MLLFDPAVPGTAPWSGARGGPPFRAPPPDLRHEYNRGTIVRSLKAIPSEGVDLIRAIPLGWGKGLDRMWFT